MVQPLGHLLGVGSGVPVRVMEQHQLAVGSPDRSRVSSRLYLKQVVYVSSGIKTGPCCVLLRAIHYYGALWGLDIAELRRALPTYQPEPGRTPTVAEAAI